MTKQEEIFYIGDRVTVKGYGGVVFYIHGLESNISYDWDDDDECEIENEFYTGAYECVMVGDDRIHNIWPDEMTLFDNDVCSCGDSNCGWDLQ